MFQYKLVDPNSYCVMAKGKKLVCLKIVHHSIIIEICIDALIN